MTQDLTADSTIEPTLGDVIADVSEALRERARIAQSARKALELLREPGALDRIDVLIKALSALGDVDLSTLGVDPSGYGIPAALTRRLQGLRQQVRTTLMAGIQRAAEQREVSAALVAQQPPTMALSPLTVELDMDAGKATLHYARYAVMEVGLDPDKIVDARARTMERIRQEAQPSELFFATLRLAYRMVLVRAGLRQGERVDIVDLLPPLTMLQGDPKRMRRSGMRTLPDYPRYLLAYQLQRLRREGMLELAGARVELGTATGGSARNKNNVLFVPNSATEGQYYLSIRVTAT